LIAELRIFGRTSCVLTTKEDDVRGELSCDGGQIAWSDGDSWIRSKPRRPEQDEAPQPLEGAMEADQALAEDDGAQARDAAASSHAVAAAEEAAVAAVLAKDAVRLASAFRQGAPVSTEVVVAECWSRFQWDLGEHRRETPAVQLLFAAILLEWPPGVELCVQHGSDVNTTYSGPLRSKSGVVEVIAAAAPLRVALSARGPAQCLLCRLILGGRVRAKTVHSLRKKARAEMEPDTAYLLDNWSGPFFEDRGDGAPVAR